MRVKRREVYSSCLCVFFVHSADVNPEHHVRIMEALITAGGLMEMQAAPGRMRNLHMTPLSLSEKSHRRSCVLSLSTHKHMQFIFSVFCSVTKSLKFVSRLHQRALLTQHDIPFPFPAAPQAAVENTRLVCEICGKHKLFPQLLR